ncbi:molybdopterin-synthase adenylyltransferase MoeB [Pseudohalocynthiibacter aestuariivivens]|nr:molybdopterin-synthase adenylyltransferase MoeB [Pseudohalocynthiibacter aestuariivivens]QIE46417.1 molybdopterin-synthase adenylyltransferase MoeB [Pseudohalocynthiibacter aestuariivivens]
MLLVLGLAAALWALGALLGTPARVRWGMIACLWIGVVVLHLLLPDDHALRLATGGSAAPWLLLGGVAALGLGYGRVLGWLRARSGQRAPVPQQTGSFSDAELERYARHIVLREVGGPGQKKLKAARVLVIGAGGLGSPAMLYLAAAGVGTIGVIDDDVVDASNLQRQVIHPDAAIGLPKVQSAATAIAAQNPHVTVRPYQRRLTEEIAADLIADYDIVLEGVDNFETRYLANRVAAGLGKPLVSGALSQWEGQIAVFDPAQGAPCYECVFAKAPEAHLAPSCAEAGVMGALPGVIGAMMAGEAIKLITGAGAPLRGEMLIYDALYADARKFKLTPRDDCPVCGNRRTGEKETT